jgi:hypothetical protein
MQSAYAEYRRSSEVLECTRQSSVEPITEDFLRLAMLEGQQRLAFERYMDARIGFLESRFDEMNRPEAGAVGAGIAASVAGGQASESGIKVWLSRASSRPVLQTLAVMLLCTMSFSLMSEQKRVRELEAGQDGLRAALLRTGQEVRLLREKLDAPKPPAATPQVQTTPAAPAKRAPASRRASWKPSPRRGGTRPQSQQHSQQKAAANRAPAADPAARTAGGRNSYDFSLPASRDFKRVGPLSILVKSTNPQTGSVSLSIVSETVEVDVPSLKTSQPVWIHTAHGHRVGLVADRIMANRLEGHLVEAESGKRDLGASRTRPNLEGAP